MVGAPCTGICPDGVDDAFGFGAAIGSDACLIGSGAGAGLELSGGSHWN